MQVALQPSPPPEDLPEADTLFSSDDFRMWCVRGGYQGRVKKPRQDRCVNCSRLCVNCSQLQLSSALQRLRPGGTGSAGTGPRVRTSGTCVCPVLLCIPKF